MAEEWAKYARPYKYDTTPLEEVRKEYPHLLLTVQRDFPTLSVEEQQKIISLVLGTCSACYSAATGCHCWNDE